MIKKYINQITCLTAHSPKPEQISSFNGKVVRFSPNKLFNFNFPSEFKQFSKYSLVSVRSRFIEIGTTILCIEVFFLERSFFLSFPFFCLLLLLLFCKIIFL